MRVLLIGINYWPEETGIAPYTTGLAEHLAARGHETTVLTGVPHYPQWRVLESYAGRLRTRESLRGVQVRRFRHYVPGRQSALRRALYEGTFLLNALATTQPSRPQMVIGVVPSLSGGVLAAAAATRYRVPFGLIFQDLMGPAAGQSGIAGGGRVMRVTGALENQIAARAAGVAIIAEGFRPYLEAGGVEPDRIWRVRNWTHIGEPTEPRPRTRARLGFSPDEFVCLHAGNMGLKQGLENVIACARLALHEPPTMRFVLMGDGNQRAALTALAGGLPNVRFLPPQPERDFPNVLAAADVLLVNQRGTVTDMSLPSKLTSYFMVGRPIAAAVAPGETAHEVASSGAGLVVPPDNPSALLAALNRLATEPRLAEELASAGPAYAEEHLTASAALSQIERFVFALSDTSSPAGSAGGVPRHAADAAPKGAAWRSHPTVGGA